MLKKVYYFLKKILGEPDMSALQEWERKYSPKKKENPYLGLVARKYKKRYM